MNISVPRRFRRVLAIALVAASSVATGTTAQTYVKWDTNSPDGKTVKPKTLSWLAFATAGPCSKRGMSASKTVTVSPDYSTLTLLGEKLLAKAEACQKECIRNHYSAEFVCNGFNISRDEDDKTCELVTLQYGEAEWCQLKTGDLVFDWFLDSPNWQTIYFHETPGRETPYLKEAYDSWKDKHPLNDGQPKWNPSKEMYPSSELDRIVLTPAQSAKSYTALKDGWDCQGDDLFQSDLDALGLGAEKLQQLDRDYVAVWKVSLDQCQKYCSWVGPAGAPGVGTVMAENPCAGVSYSAPVSRCALKKKGCSPAELVQNTYTYYPQQ